MFLFLKICLATVLYLQRGRGSIASPSSVNTGDVLGELDFLGNVNKTLDGFVTASIRSVSTRAFGPTSSTRGASLEFYNIDGAGTADNVFAASQQRMIITGNGQIGIPGRWDISYS